MPFVVLSQLVSPKDGYSPLVLESALHFLVKHRSLALEDVLPLLRYSRPGLTGIEEIVGMCTALRHTLAEDL